MSLVCIETAMDDTPWSDSFKVPIAGLIDARKNIFIDHQTLFRQSFPSARTKYGFDT